MAVQLKVLNDKIRATIVQSSCFSEIVQVLKDHQARYDPKSYSWILSPPKVDEICEALEDLDVLIISEKTKEEIKLLQKPVVKSSIDRIEFSVEDLKAPPFEGRSPYEKFQLEDVAKCVNHIYYALFNEQGTGKSYVLISALEILRKYRNLKKVLFVTSNSGVINIKKEFKRFSNFDTEKIAIGGIRNRRPFVDETDVVICSYRSFLLISDEYQKDRDKKTGRKTKKYRSTPIPLEAWLHGEYSAIVLDESHFISNSSARQTQALHLVREFFNRAYLATGTPADSEEKYYSQLTFLEPTLTHNFSYLEWLEEYADIGNRFSRQAINFFKKEKKAQLADIVQSVSVKRLADECLELPEHLEKTVYVELSDLQKEIYETLVREKLKEIHRAQAMDLKTIRNYFPYFIEGIDNPCMLVDNEKVPESVQKLARRFTFDKHSKLEALDELLEKHAKSSKIILWCFHPSVGFALQSYLKKYKTMVINGQSKPKGCKDLDEYKNAVVDEFQNSDVQILIAGIPVLNSSVTIVKANVQIYFEKEFNYVNVNQSNCRIIRIGQEKTVYTYSLVAESTLDVIRQESLKDKDFINRKFGSKEYLDQETLKSIFNGDVY
jgi:SNF2 family DNA or RNA helicase